MDYALEFSVNNRLNRFDIKSASFERGKDECLFNENLFSNIKLKEQGFLVTDFSADWHITIQRSITKFIKHQISRYTNKSLAGFKLEDYHLYVDAELHKKIVQAFRGGVFGLGGIHLSELGIPYQQLDTFINDTIGSNLSCHYRRYGLSLKLVLQISYHGYY